MNNKIKFNERLKSLQKQRKVYRVFLLCGSNDVEEILVKGNSVLEQVQCQLKANVDLLLKMYPQATVGIVNVLPRADPAKMQVVEEINKFLAQTASMYGNKVYFINTYTYGMFTSNRGKNRLARFFRSIHADDKDNVHLNLAGIARLGKHLKYIAHNGNNS